MIELIPAIDIIDGKCVRLTKGDYDTNITGVDFKSGMNTPTYKYYIDFAAKNNIEYIIIDEGWSNSESLTEGLNPDIDLKTLIDYGKRRGESWISVLFQCWHIHSWNFGECFEERRASDALPQ